MTVGSIEGVVGTSRVSEPMRKLISLPHADYADQFTLSVTTDATPEQWARAMFGDVPSPAERFIWRGILGLRLKHERSPSTVGGWHVTGHGENWIRLEVASWFLSANMIVMTVEEGVSWGTFLHYEREIGRVAWPALSIVHRQLVPGVLRAASTRMVKHVETGL